MKTILTVIVLILAALAVLYLTSAKKGTSLMPPDSFKQAHQKNPGTVIDVRTQREYEGGHLKIADHNFDLISGIFEDKLASLNKQETYYLYCRTGSRSGKAASIMADSGFTNVYNVGGFESLVNAGFEAK